jgi:hypothetical protein
MSSGLLKAPERSRKFVGSFREKPHYFSIILIIDTPKSIFISTSITIIINRII